MPDLHLFNLFSLVAVDSFKLGGTLLFCRWGEFHLVRKLKKKILKTVPADFNKSEALLLWWFITSLFIVVRCVIDSYFRKLRLYSVMINPNALRERERERESCWPLKHSLSPNPLYMLVRSAVIPKVLNYWEIDRTMCIKLTYVTPRFTRDSSKINRENTDNEIWTEEDLVEL